MVRVFMRVLIGAAILSGAAIGQEASVESAGVSEEGAEIVDRHSLETELTPVTGEPLPAVDLYISFEFDSAVLTQSAKRQLEELAAALNSEALKGAAFGVYGHTDASGSAGYNLALSEKRAAAVSTFLTETASVEPDRLTRRGFGKTRLKDPLRPYDSANRRVEIVMLTPPGKNPADDNGMTAITQ